MPAPADADSSQADPRARLLAAAGPVFARLGFDRATLREIAAAADVNVAAVAYYFRDKMGLYREVVQQMRQSRDRRFPVPNNTAQDEPRIALARLVHTMLSRMLVCDQPGWETQLMMREMDHPTIAFKELVNDFFRPLFNQLITTLRRLIAESRPNLSVPEHTLEQLALSAVGQCLYYRIGRGVVEILIPQQRREEQFDIESISRHVTSVMIAATNDCAVLTERENLDSLLANSSGQSTSLPAGDQTHTNSTDAHVIPDNKSN